MTADEAIAKEPDNSELELIYVARQPVFDPNMVIWGYELLFRHSSQINAAVIENGDMATSRVIADGFGMAAKWLSKDQKVLINYPSSMLLKQTPTALPPGIGVVEILENVRPDKEILDACLELKKQGYILALDDYVGAPGYEPLLEVADIVKVDVLNTPKADLSRLLGRLRNYKCTLLAEKVEDLESFDRCRKLGFDFFQGFFFSRPQIIKGRRLTASQLSKLELMRLLGSDDPDLIGISKIIKSDVSLSYRLLRYINSAGMGIANKIKSISQAVSLLGQRQISAWLRVIILAEMNVTSRGGELVFFSLQRARFLEQMARIKKLCSMTPDSMFMLGLFSCLDALLSQPMKDILEKISLEPRLTKALLGDDKELQTWLDLVLACEKGQWARAEEFLGKVEISPEQAAVMLNRSTIWAKHFLNMT